MRPPSDVQDTCEGVIHRACGLSRRPPLWCNFAKHAPQSLGKSGLPLSSKIRRLSTAEGAQAASRDGSTKYPLGSFDLWHLSSQASHCQNNFLCMRCLAGSTRMYNSCTEGRVRIKCNLVVTPSMGESQPQGLWLHRLPFFAFFVQIPRELQVERPITRPRLGGV